MINIGILEDNVPLRVSMEDYFGVLGDYNIVFSASGSSCLQIDTVTKLDFILLDIHLQNESGIDIIPKIKRLFPDVHVIVITGDTVDQFLLLDAIENGASSFLYKPFQGKNLTRIINELQTTSSYIEPELLTVLINLIRSRNKVGKLLAHADKQIIK